jgi:hypothetical protein
MDPYLRSDKRKGLYQPAGKGSSPSVGFSVDPEYSRDGKRLATKLLGRISAVSSSEKSTRMSVSRTSINPLPRREFLHPFPRITLVRMLREVESGSAEIP